LVLTIITVTNGNIDALRQTMLSLYQQKYVTGSTVRWHIQCNRMGPTTSHTLNTLLLPVPDWLSLHIEIREDDGIYHGMNYALEAILAPSDAIPPCDFIWFLNAGDCLATPQTLNKTLEHLKNNHADLIFAASLQFQKGKSDTWYRPSKPINHLGHGLVTSHQAIIYRAGLFKTYGIYNTNYKIAADYELTSRFVAQGSKTSIWDEAIIQQEPYGLSHQKRSIGRLENKKIRETVWRASKWLNYTYYIKDHVASCLSSLSPSLYRLIRQSNNKRD